MLNYTKAFSGMAVDDLPRAREFYGETLGLKATVLDEEHHLLNLELADGRAVLVYGKPDHQPANFTILNFQVDDIDQAVDGLRVRALRRHAAGREGRHARGRPLHRLVPGPGRQHPLRAAAAPLSARQGFALMKKIATTISASVTSVHVRTVARAPA
jgi:catechol 2,3-dioxygenase-like lactoylglutathione lyase family enzyme